MKLEIIDGIIHNTWQSKSELEVNANNDWLIELQSKSKIKMLKEIEGYRQIHG